MIADPKFEIVQPDTLIIKEDGVCNFTHNKSAVQTVCRDADMYQQLKGPGTEDQTLSPRRERNWGAGGWGWNGRAFFKSCSQNGDISSLDTSKLMGPTSNLKS